MPEVVGRLRTPRAASAPTSPQNGEEYYDTTSNRLYWWNGTQWVPAGGGSTIAAAKMRCSTSPTLAAGWQKIPLNISVYGWAGPLPSGTDPTNGRYVVPMTGFWQVNGDVEGQTPGAATDVVLSIWVNGNERSRGDRQRDPGGNILGLGVSDLLRLNQGDWVELWMYSNPSFGIQAGVQSNRLALHMVPGGVPGPSGALGTLPITPALSATSPANPVDGQLWFYPAGANGEVWLFRYRAISPSGSPYKWEFVSGSDLISGPMGSIGSTGTGAWLVFGGGPSITLPLVGEFEFEWGAIMQGAVGGTFGLNVGLGAPGIVSNYCTFISTQQWNTGTLSLTARLGGLGGSTGYSSTVTLMVNVDNGYAYNIGPGWIRATPVRVLG